MWLQRSIVIGLLFLVAGCGFHPVYGDAAMQATHTPLQGNLKIDPIAGREGQILKIALEDRFNPEGITYAAPDYHLSVDLNKTLIPAVVKSDGTIQRYDVRMTSSFRLYKTGNTTPVFTGTVSRTGSYDVTTNAEFATFEADRDTIERTLDEMAEDYVLRISGHFASLK